MIIQLDPFHLIRAINCPEPGVTAQDVGSIIAADNPATDLGVWGCSLRPPFAACPTLIDYDETEWVFSTWNLGLPGNILFCDQMIFRITGRTSGISRTIDMYRVMTDAGIDCDTSFIDFCDGREWCYGYVGEDIVGSPLLNNSANSWSPFSDTHFVQAAILTRDPIGWILGERIDVTLPPVTLEIDKIVEGNFNRARVFPLGGNPGIATDSRVQVEGTENYDGRYNAELAGSLIVELDTPFTVEETGVGTIAPDYVPII